MPSKNEILAAKKASRFNLKEMPTKPAAVAKEAAKPEPVVAKNAKEGKQKQGKNKA